ncbi:MAG: hypothetical protein H7256_16405 [Bdellovibrio sp.]|nr:hypothetical protein [Bdellovibrio sp.]
MNYSFKNETIKVRIFLFIFFGVVLFQYPTFAQPVSKKLMAPAISRMPSAAEAEDKGQLTHQLIEALGISKAVEAAVENSGAYFKNVPAESNAVLQKKIATLYLDAEKKFNAQKEQQRNQVLADIKQQFVNQFSLEELKYLIVLSKYPVYRRFQTFLDSEQYRDLMGKPFITSREAVTKLKSQIKELKASATMNQLNK